MVKSRARSISVPPLMHSRKMLKLMGTTGLVLSSGYFAWQTYSLKQTSNVQDRIINVALQTKINPESDYLEIPDYKTSMLPMDSKSEIKSMIPRHLRKCWKLLHQANVGSYEQHLLAVRDLSKLSKSLSDGDMRQLAQSSSIRTCVGLARVKNVDLRFFLKPAPIPKEVRLSSIQSLFKQVLSSMPKNEDPGSKPVHDCIKFFTTTALENYVPGSDDDTIRDIDIDLEFQRETHHIHAIPRRRYSMETIVEYCLQALLSHSTLESHCMKMLTTPSLPLFVKLIEEFPNNAKIKSIIGKILANMSLFPETHKAIFSSGWVGILAQWKQSPNLLVTLPATKALCNLDQAFGHTYDPGIYLLLPTDRNVQHVNELSNWGIDVVFLHGLLGGVFYTWRQSDPNNERQWGSAQLSSTEDYSFCWPRDWLETDSVMRDRVRVIGVDFDTSVSQWGNTCPKESFKTSLVDRSEDILQKLKKSGVGQRPVIFVGHSMGGLIIKQMLTRAAESGGEKENELVKNTKGIVFYSTPHSGTQVAKLNATARFFFFPSTEVRDLEADSPRLSQLNHSFVELAKANNFRIVSFGETVPTPIMGMDLTFVPPQSSNPGIGEFHLIKNVNHMNICKPENKSSILYRKFLNLVWDALDDATPFEMSP